MIPEAAAPINGLNVALAEEVRREIAETVALFAAAQDAEDKRKKA